MNAPGSHDAHEGLSASQKAALLNLLADEDPTVYATVYQRIMACGTEATEWLRPHQLSSDPLLRRRVRAILLHFNRLEADTRFLAFCLGHGSGLDLERGMLLLAQTRFPACSSTGYSALLDLFASTLRERISPEEGAASVLATLNAYLFDELGFRGNQKEYYDPENSYFNRVLDRRVGNPISLCVLYWLVGRRLRLPLVGVAMPGHFLCRYQTSTECFFVDAFNRGKLLTRAHCISYLQQSKHGYTENYLMPATPVRTLLRMCSNLHQIYAERQEAEETARVQRYLIALSRHAN